MVKATNKRKPGGRRTGSNLRLLTCWLLAGLLFLAGVTLVLIGQTLPLTDGLVPKLVVEDASQSSGGPKIFANVVVPPDYPADARAAAIVALNDASQNGSVGPVGPRPLSRDELFGVWEASDENNAKFPGPRPGDVTFHTQAADRLPGVDLDHMHGRLGLKADGTPRFTPVPLPWMGLTDDERRDSHRGFCFNSRVSDSIPVDRPQRDQRSGACVALSKTYPYDLPVASVVIVFHNELFSALVRSIHSVLNYAPPRLLKEVIVVDDASLPVEDRFYQKHYDRLQRELEEYCASLPKVTFVRLKERRGLMLARMEGLWRATSEVVVFLDSHIEATPGFMEPMLARIKESGGGAVVVPSIDTIGTEDLKYRGAGGLGVLFFSWTLGQEPMHADNGDDGTKPAKSPVMAGGLLATDRRWFLKLGGYDPEMRLYGGEEMEIGFRTWMCGGSIEHIPCSHVGHIFRTPQYWQGQVYKVPGDEIVRNKLRAAKVWMDHYGKLVEYAVSTLPESNPIGDLQPRTALREKLRCHDFTWYIKNVIPDLYVPKLSSDVVVGALQNGKFERLCVDTMGRKQDGSLLGTYPCHYLHGTQALIFADDGLLLLPESGYRHCLGAADDAKNVAQIACRGESRMRWRSDASNRLVLTDLNLCLTANEETQVQPSLSLEACWEGSLEQVWHWV